MLAAALADVLKLRMDVVACWHHTDIYAASQIPNPGLPEGDPFQTETANMAEHVIDLAFGTEAPAGMTFHTRYGHPARILEGESATAGCWPWAGEAAGASRAADRFSYCKLCCTCPLPGADCQ